MPPEDESGFYEYVESKEGTTWFVSLEENGCIFIPFCCNQLKRITPIEINEDPISLFPGLYSIGTDFPAGKYVITCKTNDSDSGIIYVSTADDVIKGYSGSELHEYVDNNSEEEFLVTLEEGGRMYIPFVVTIQQDKGVVFE